MSTKSIAKIILIALCFVTVITASSCAILQGDVMKEINNIKDFVLVDVKDTVAAVNDPSLTTEGKIAKAEELIHPKSTITREGIIEDIKNNEKLQSITSANNIKVVEMPGFDDLATIAEYNEELGGFTYNAELTVSIDGVMITVDITLFSDDDGMGIYDYNIK